MNTCIYSTFGVKVTVRLVVQCSWLDHDVKYFYILVRVGQHSRSRLTRIEVLASLRPKFISLKAILQNDRKLKVLCNRLLTSRPFFSWKYPVPRYTSTLACYLTACCCSNRMQATCFSFAPKSRATLCSEFWPKFPGFGTSPVLKPHRYTCVDFLSDCRVQFWYTFRLVSVHSPLLYASSCRAGIFCPNRPIS